MSSPRILRLTETDNVVVALDPVRQGAELDQGLRAARAIPRGHKIASCTISEGEPIRKLGQTIGFAGVTISPGEWVHEHNIVMQDFDRDYAFATDATPREALLPGETAATFEGFRRPGDRIGTRNYLGILTSVNCSATVAGFIATAVERSGILADYPNVDGVIAFTHGTGCGMAASGEGFDLLSRTQWGYATHANLAGILLVGLGCEVFQIPRLKAQFGVEEGEHFRSMTIQEKGGTRRSIEAGVERVKEMLPLANSARRETVPASELTLALQCGGSDGYSALTANPALGAAADMLVRQGGTAVLSETPEIFGAEHLLTRRAENETIGRRIVDLIEWWKVYAARSGGELNNNPSPGNKAGGLTTILEKSLGSVAKGGTSTLRGVYRYAERIDRKGFVFMDTPGFDPVAATGQVAGGANILCFTTGRGSAYGCKPTPSIKLATNSDLYHRMQEDMDVNCGDILDGVTIAEKGREIFQRILRVASGERSKSELLGYGSSEFVPWQLGATM
ncbi:UxaA family hydrolase [Bradyrhizobium mercantei]|uniref:UxaA family hydrolase n=1 Tax=Bradyrhizobium mercantei TaxID=1904807 RepID=UPI0009777C01|nr:altronate dehydratase family protein [Bradyrhizobium mercantei]